MFMERFLREVYGSLNGSLLLDARSISFLHRTIRPKDLVDPTDEVSLASGRVSRIRVGFVAFELIFMDFRRANETGSRHEHDRPPWKEINWMRLQLYGCHHYTAFTGSLKRRCAAPYEIVND